MPVWGYAAFTVTVIPLGRLAVIALARVLRRKYQNQQLPGARLSPGKTKKGQ
jgi:hypothetical protein